MGLKEQIKSFLQQAGVYQRQGLFDEAMANYQKAIELAKQNRHTKGADQFIADLTRKMQVLNQQWANVKQADKPRQMNTATENLIQNLFSFGKEDNPDAAALEGAIALAKFGQHKRALQEFNKLLDKADLRIVVAKNILRCVQDIGSSETAVKLFAKWFDDDRFSVPQLKKLRSFLRTITQKKGAMVSIPEVPEPAAADVSTGAAAVAADVDTSAAGSPSAAPNPPMPAIEEEEEFLDISSVGITFSAGPEQGKTREFDISFQTGNKLSLIVAKQEQKAFAHINEGSRLTNLQFFSPIAILNGSATIISKAEITAGPKRGDISLDMIIETV
jgi:tetratricopeptide (TPR) repeat protein